MSANHSLRSEASPRAETKRLLVTGAGGNLGWFLCRLGRRAGWEIVGGHRRNSVDIPGVSWRKMDLSRVGELPAILSGIGPDAVIHAAAVTGVNRCEARPEETREVNVAASEAVARWCAENGAPMAFASSDMVFGGDRAPYRETDPPAPICRYGEQKAEAEKRVLRAWPEATVCRLPLLFGMSGGARTTFDAQMVADLKRGRSVLLFRDEFRTPVDLESAAAGILDLLGRVRGVVHLGGPQRVSRYEMGRIVAELLEMDPSLLLPVRQRDVPMANLRPADLSLDSRRAFDAGYRPRGIADGYRRMLFFRSPGTSAREE